MGTEETLKRETGKWLLRIEREIRKVKARDKKGREFLTNIQAYIKDSRYFMDRGDLVRAFEAVIWGWAYLSISRKLRLLKAQEQ